MQRIKHALAFACAVALAGCGTSPQLNAAKGSLRSSARQIVGNSLIGAHGATPADQEAIDETAAGICVAQVWTADECRRHGELSRAKRS